MIKSSLKLFLSGILIVMIAFLFSLSLAFPLELSSASLSIPRLDLTPVGDQLSISEGTSFSNIIFYNSLNQYISQSVLSYTYMNHALRLSERSPLTLWDINLSVYRNTSQNLSILNLKSAQPAMRNEFKGEPYLGTSLFLRKAISRLRVVYYIEDLSSNLSASYPSNSISANYVGGVTLSYFLSNKFAISSSHQFLRLAGDKLNFDRLSNLSATYFFNSSLSLSLDLVSEEPFKFSDSENLSTSFKVVIRF